MSAGSKTAAGAETLFPGLDARSLGFVRDPAGIDGALKQLASRAVERDLRGGSLEEELRELARLGVTAARLPLDAGGGGLGYAQTVDLIVALARADSSAAQSLRSHFLHVEHVVQVPEAPGSAIDAREIAQGRIFGSATTEVGNVQVGAVDTRVARGADGRLRLNGRKFYTTGAGYADWVNVFAADDAGTHVIATVPRRAEGVVVVDDWDGIGQRLTMSGSMHFENVLVEPGRVRPRSTAEGARSARHDAMAQLTHLATLAGIAIRAFEDAAGWLQGRQRHFSHAAASTPAEDPVVQEIVGRVSAVAGTALHAVRSAARQLEAHVNAANEEGCRDAHRTVTQLQVVLPSLVMDAAQSLFDIGGGSLTVASRGFDRHWRNARTLASHNPSPQKARVLGHEALNGVPLPDIWYAGTAPTVRA
ncbi:acyl-CoA dehydrogenase family protein [Xylophilus sp.]|uniref:acyl-CoA dehydrogenase family protein n=1 Tax=Xylophilus sp. TaxID=2653893 RepID=UPI0013BD997D|nr:acyl-CoA dehydrogenase family protein [Xylophilus sp.]KAF1044559.1 MAG: Dibenzothiophene desulfurization enzyme C [Xylophilus sp.]